MHTPAELYGSREAAEGIRDETWLADVGPRRWVAISRDTKIMQRPAELAAYRAAKLHLMLFPGRRPGRCCSTLCAPPWLKSARSPPAASPESGGCIAPTDGGPSQNCRRRRVGRVNGSTLSQGLEQV